MINYIIYKIIHNNKTIYVGSTTIKLSHRKQIHQYYYTKKNCNLYLYIRNNDCFDELEFIEIYSDKVYKNQKDKIHQMEQNYIDILCPTLNQRRSYVGILRNSNFTLNDYQKKYRSYNVDCECGKTIKKYCQYQHLKSKFHINYQNSLNECILIKN